MALKWKSILVLINKATDKNNNNCTWTYRWVYVTISDPESSHFREIFLKNSFLGFRNKMYVISLFNCSSCFWFLGKNPGPWKSPDFKSLFKVLVTWDVYLYHCPFLRNILILSSVFKISNIFVVKTNQGKRMDFALTKKSQYVRDIAVCSSYRRILGNNPVPWQSLDFMSKSLLHETFILITDFF